MTQNVDSLTKFLEYAIARKSPSTQMVEAAALEINRLRQGLWDCAGIAGTDQDGMKSPEALVSPDIVEYAQAAVRDLREAYDAT